MMKPEEMDSEAEEKLAGALMEFRAAAMTETARDETFWETQRRAVMGEIQRPKRFFQFRPALVWSIAAVIILMVVVVRREGPQALPAPDFACGYDQELLSDVEKMIRAPMPSAFEPAMILVQDIDRGSSPRPDTAATQSRRQ
jgi:hypothetical protein